jgi:hypothetical protein
LRKPVVSFVSFPVSTTDETPNGIIVWRPTSSGSLRLEPFGSGSRSTIPMIWSWALAQSATPWEPDQANVFIYLFIYLSIYLSIHLWFCLASG